MKLVQPQPPEKEKVQVWISQEIYHDLIELIGSEDDNLTTSTINAILYVAIANLKNS